MILTESDGFGVRRPNCQAPSQKAVGLIAAVSGELPDDEPGATLAHEHLVCHRKQLMVSFRP